MVLSLMFELTQALLPLEFHWSINDAAMEDASWLSKEKNDQHMYLAELNAVLKGVSMALM